MKSRCLVLAFVFVSEVWASSGQECGAEPDAAGLPVAVAVLHEGAGVSEETRQLDASAADVPAAIAALRADVGGAATEDLRSNLALIAAALRAHLPAGSVPEGAHLTAITAAAVDALSHTAFLERRLRTAEAVIDCLTRSQDAMTSHIMSAGTPADHRAHHHHEADSDDGRGEGGASASASEESRLRR